MENKITVRVSCEQERSHTLITLFRKFLQVLDAVHVVCFFFEGLHVQGNESEESWCLPRRKPEESFLDEHFKVRNHLGKGLKEREGAEARETFPNTQLALSAPFSCLIVLEKLSPSSALTYGTVAVLVFGVPVSYKSEDSAC